MDNEAELSTVKEMPIQPGLSWLTERAMRHLLFKAKTNGLAQTGAIIKLGTLMEITARTLPLGVRAYPNLGLSRNVRSMLVTPT